MSEPNDDQDDANGRAGAFDTTHWSVVVQAGAEGSGEAVAALEKLCRTYWPPLYAYVRRQGHAPHDAQDLVQEFFTRFLEHQYVRLVTPARGRFRSFLLTSLKHFLINEWKQANRQKRGGGQQIVSLDGDEMETRLALEPGYHRTPDKAFERQWALVVLGRVLDQLQAEFIAAGRGPVFEELKPCLTGEDREDSYAEAALRLGMTETNLKVTVHRMRLQYRELLKKEILRTVEDPALVDEEIQHLILALSN